MANSDQLLYTSIRNGYLPGENIQAELFGLDGASRGRASFQILAYAGSGFAGQVYQALPSGPGLGEPPVPVALKILKPKHAWKRILRDGLFQVCFQCLFTARLREAAVQAGLIWQALLRAAAAGSLGAGSVAQPLGYYWDAGQASFVEVHEWVASRPVRFQADDRMFEGGRRLKEGGSEMARKQAFMDSLVRLCRQAGASGLARQFQWWTLVAPANVLSRLDPEKCGPDSGGPESGGSAAGAAQFAAVDFRPGLAVPFFLPISPAHLALILDGLRRGRLVHYDEIDLAQLKSFSHQAGAALRPWRELLPQLRKAEAAQRYARPDLWQSRLGFFRSRDRRRTAAGALVDDWVRLGQVDLERARQLKNSRTRFWLAYGCGWLPILGGLVRTASFHHGYRAHLKALVTRPAYFRLAFLAAKRRDLPEWSAEGRVSAARLARLEGSNWLYCRDRLALSWLPARLQRLLSDRAELRRLAGALIGHPLRLMLRPEYRLAWLRTILARQMGRGLISAGQLEGLENQLSEPRLAGFGRDLGLTVGLEVFSKTIYALLAVYGLASGDFLPLALAALGPVPPSGAIRAGYVAARLAWELPGIWRRRDRQLLVGRLIGLAVAPWRWVGNLFAPLEMFGSYPQLSLLMAEYFVTGMVRVVPVLGGPGLALEYWAFQVVYNLPLSLRRWLAGHF